MDITTDLWDCHHIAFYGNQAVILVSGYSKILRTYDVVRGTQISEGNLPLGTNELLIHWVDGESLLFATSFETGEGIVINIQDLQPTSNPPFPVVESFLVPSRGGVSSFSPVSFHASFLTDEVVVLDVRDTRVLLHVEIKAQFGHFSPDGRFFVYATPEYGTCVWKNTSSGYEPWSTLGPRIDCGLAFSPTGTSILSWSMKEIQLFDNHLRPPPPNKIKYRQDGDGVHLVAYSADGTHIAAARSGGDLVMIFDPLLDTPRSISTNMRIRDIKIFNNAIFVMDDYELVSWDLEAGRDSHCVRRGLYGLVAVYTHLVVTRFTLSNDCSQVAITTPHTIFLYGITAQQLLGKFTIAIMAQGITEVCSEIKIWDVQFSPDGHQLWFILGKYHSEQHRPLYCATLYITEGRCFTEVTKEPLENGWSQDSCFPPPGYRIRLGSRWIEDSEGGKLFWLPPNWRTANIMDAKWNGDFLALVGRFHPEPLIIKFQPRPLLFRTHPTRSPNV